ncbi:MAG: HK97 family phage prohead protease, partial [Mycobacterium sp.]|nr:HK97 family phage prohead protease [Mycobacterium sp.]
PDEVPGWMRRLPDWVREDEIRWLAKRPWVAAFIRADDYSLDPAIERFEASQCGVSARDAAAAAELVTLRAVNAAIETTSLRQAGVAHSAGLTRSVTVQSPDARSIRGLAVPYGQRSLPVMACGIACFEMFDRRSFEYLPLSAPLRDSHDWDADPVGEVTSLRHTDAGLAIKARVDRDGPTWLCRWVRGEHSSLSIAFASAPALDDWTTWAGKPVRTVRKARLFEVSIVRDPAYRAARIVEVVDAGGEGTCLRCQSGLYEVPDRCPTCGRSRLNGRPVVGDYMRSGAQS